MNGRERTANTRNIFRIFRIFRIKATPQNDLELRARFYQENPPDEWCGTVQFCTDLPPGKVHNKQSWSWATQPF
jgi:hypothetical protein